MLLNYENEIRTSYCGGCQNKYFKTGRSGGNDIYKMIPKTIETSM